jgi:hypothetical protein
MVIGTSRSFGLLYLLFPRPAVPSPTVELYKVWHTEKKAPNYLLGHSQF